MDPNRNRHRESSRFASKSARFALFAVTAALAGACGDTRETRPNAASERFACRYGAGSFANETLADAARLGADIPIDHFVVVMQENRSFDHYFAKLASYGQDEVDVAPDSIALASLPCSPNLPHDWNGVHREWDGGKMDGFAPVAGVGAFAGYDSTTLPYYYDLANRFSVADHYFASALAPTYPNRMFALAASSFGNITNTPPPPRDEERSIFHELEARGLAWAVYSDTESFEERIFPRLRQEAGEHFESLDDFFVDARSGNLPHFAWIESSIGGADANDEHPPADVQVGQAFVSRVISALFASPEWSRTAIFVTYDESGGYFDHVAPPSACAPDDIEAKLGGSDEPGKFDRLGMRVPLVAVSPWSRAHYVSHVPHSHTSLLRMVEARFSLPALSRRDANDEPPFELFDFERPHFTQPPELAAAVLNLGLLATCRARFGATTP